MLTYIINTWFVAEIILLIFLLPKILKGKKIKLTGNFYIAPAAIGMLVGAVQGAVGIGQKIKASKMAKNNKRPVLKDNPYVEDMYNLTGSYANQGLTESSKQAYLSNNDRNLTASIDALLKVGGGANLVSDIYSGSVGNIREMAVAEQQAKNKNIDRYITQGLMPKANQERDKFFLNEMAPFQDKAKMISDLSSQGMTNIFKGINTAGSAYIKGLEAKMYDTNKPAIPDGGDFSNFTRINTGAATAIPTGRKQPVIPGTLMPNSNRGQQENGGWDNGFYGPWNMADWE